MLKTRMQLKPAEYKNVLQAARKVLMVRIVVTFYADLVHKFGSLVSDLSLETNANMYVYSIFYRRRARLDSWMVFLSGQYESRFIRPFLGLSPKRLFGGTYLARKITLFKP